MLRGHVAARVHYLRGRDIADRGGNVGTVVRDWMAGRPGLMLAPVGADLRELEAGAGLPAPVAALVDLNGDLHDASVLLLWPDDRTLDTVDHQLTPASRVLVLLDVGGPTALGWLRRYRAVHVLDGSTLHPLTGVLAEPAVEYGLRYLLSLPVRGIGHDAYHREPARSKAISAFCAFRDGGVAVEAGPLLLEFLVSNGATVSDATVLNDYAAGIGESCEARTGPGHRFRDDILQVWRAAVGLPNIR